jgi:hypothetical protein
MSSSNPRWHYEEDTMSVASRARLNFDSSFTGEDRLRVRLQAGEGNFSLLGVAWLMLVAVVKISTSESTTSTTASLWVAA